MSENSQAPAVIDAQLSIIPPSALESIERASVDLQIATAHKFPRSMQKFQERARSMALIDEDTAASCIYSRPVGGGKFAEGLSVRAAEIVGASYGNLRVGSTIVEQTETYVKARGFAHDLESNYAHASEVIESTLKKDGTPYDPRMRIVIAKSALAKASRDATFKVVPKALFKSIELECRKLALGEGQSVSTRRARIVAWITKLAIDPKRVWKALGITGEADVTDEHFLTLTGLKTSIADGEVTIDEAFPKLLQEGAVGATKTPTEEAAEEKKKQAPQDGAPKPPAAEEKKEKPADGPKPAELRKQLIAKGTELNAGKGMIAKALVSLTWIEAGKTLDDMDATQLAAAIDGWEAVAEKIKNPDGE